MLVISVLHAPSKRTQSPRSAEPLRRAIHLGLNLGIAFSGFPPETSTKSPLKYQKSQGKPGNPFDRKKD